MNIIILGPPGSGKGTFSQMLESKFNKISTGDLLRKVPENSELGKKIYKILNKGELVSDEIVIELVKKNLSKKNNVFDGFPRTLEQARDLNKIVNIDKVIYLKVSDKVIIDRLSGRLQCINCGRVYHTKNNPPKKKNVCNVCGGVLYRREDEKVIKDRLNVYKKNIDPIIKFYKEKGKLHEIDGERRIDVIIKDLEKLLNNKK